MVVLRPICRLFHIAVLGSLSLGVAAAQQTIWQIGHFDGSSRELGDSFGVDYTNPSSDVDFTVGRSHDADWKRFQPGPANGIAGGREHPFRIHFALSGEPEGTYTLRLAVLYETPRRSALRVSVNGHEGMFYFNPKLDYRAGDWEGTFVPQTSEAERAIEIPAAWLQAGENTFALTAVDSPSTPQPSLGDIAPGISGLVYDALSLDHQRGTPSRSVTLTAAPTIFFRSSKSGLREVVNLCAHVPPGTTVPATLGLAAGGFRETQAVRSTMSFGDVCRAFDVPEWTGVLKGTVAFDGHPTAVQLLAQKKWVIDIVPHEHLDAGFTDYRAKVAELQSESLDGVLDMLHSHPEFRWTMDGSRVAEQYVAGRSPQRIDQLVNAIRAGQIVLPAQFANQHTGVASLEGLARSLYPSHALSLQYKIPVGAANITDVPSYSWSYASLLHAAGIRYFAAASNSWRAPVMLLGRWNEKSPFYWEGPDGGRVLMWYSRAYLQVASMFGVSPQVEAVQDALPVFLQAYTRRDYRANSVILFGSQLENTVLDTGQVTLPERWAAIYAYPRLRFSTFDDAMHSLQLQFGEANLKTYRGDFGPYWEDGFASDAGATAQHRRNQQRIRTAETMAALPSLLNPELRPDAHFLESAWYNQMLFDEHTWSSAGAATQPESEESREQLSQKTAEVVDARKDIEQSIERSWAQLESFMAPDKNSIAVFNPLNWERSGWLEADLPEGQQVVDPASGKPVDQQVERIEPGLAVPGFGGKTVRMRFRASNIPAVGYKLLAIEPGAASPATTQPLAQVMENRYFRVTLDPTTASVRSIWDKELGRELIDPESKFHAGAYVYVTGGDDIPNNSLYRYSAGVPMPVLTPHIAEHGRLVRLRMGPAGQTAVMEADAFNTPMVRTEVTLPGDAKRIDLRIRLGKQETLHKEAAYIAFPFAVSKPAFAYDTQNGFVNPATDELAGGSREWYAAQHWAAVHNQDVSLGVVTVDAPLVAFGDIVRGAWPERFEAKSSTIFSWIMGNYWNTNFPASQGGDVTFEYSITSAKTFDPAAMERTSLEIETPLESNPVPAHSASTPLLSDAAGFLAIDDANVVLSTWKLAENGSGSIVRLVETAGKSSELNLSTNRLSLTGAWNCSLLEDCGEPLTVTNGTLKMTIQPYQILTLKLVTQPTPAPQLEAHP